MAAERGCHGHRKDSRRHPALQRRCVETGTIHRSPALTSRPVTMDADERDVCNYLKSWPGEFVSGRDVARRAGGKRRFRAEPEWAVPVLTRLVEMGLVDSDSTG